MNLAKSDNNIGSCFSKREKTWQLLPKRVSRRLCKPFVKLLSQDRSMRCISASSLYRNTSRFSSRSGLNSIGEDNDDHTSSKISGIRISSTPVVTNVKGSPTGGNLIFTE